MIRLTLRCSIVCTVLTAGCGTEEPAPAPSGGASEAPVVEPSMPAYEGPPVRLEVTVLDPGTLFEWSVDVPTGGWEAKFDGAGSNPRTGEFTIRVNLVQPGPDEMVTQALATVEGHYRHGKQNARTVELLVRRTIRGTADEGEFRSAAIWSADD